MIRPTGLSRRHFLQALGITSTSLYMGGLNSPIWTPFQGGRFFGKPTYPVANIRADDVQDIRFSTTRELYDAIEKVFDEDIKMNGPFPFPFPMASAIAVPVEDAWTIGK